MQQAEKKRPKEEKEILHRLRPFAKLQTAEDYEQFCADTLCMCLAASLSSSSYSFTSQTNRCLESASQKCKATAGTA